MNDCPRGDIRDLLPDLLHDRLPPARRAEVERHLLACADCAAELELLRSFRSALTRSPEVDVARLAAAVTRAPAPRLTVVGGRTRRLRSGVAAAFAALALGGLGYIVSRNVVERGGPTTEQLLQRTQAEASKPPEEIAQRAAPERAAEARTPAVSGPGPVTTSAREAPELDFGSGLSDLSNSDLQALLSEVDSLEAVPDVEPAPEATVIGEGAS